MPGDGDAAVALGIELKHHTDKLRLLLDDFKGGVAVHSYFAVAIGGVGDIPAVVDALPQSAL